MLLKDFIAELQQLYDDYPKEHRDILGEPEITIDQFHNIKAKTFSHLFEYKGVVPNIKITRTSDGVFLVVTSIVDREKLKRPTIKVNKGAVKKK